MKVALGFSFGHRAQEPGISNQAMAEVIHRLAPDAIVVQWEIGTALRKLGVTPRNEVRAHRKSGRYLDTEEVARQMIDFLYGLYGVALWNQTIFVVAHPAHLPRCVRILRKLGIIAVVPVHANIPYDPKSHQIWTRSPLLFHIREILAFPIYLYKGYYITPPNYIVPP